MKKAFAKYTAPPGEAKFASVVVPNTRFNTEGSYEITVIYEPEDAKAILDVLAAEAPKAEQQWAEKYGKKEHVARPSYREERVYDREAKVLLDETTGRLEFKFKSKRKPFLFDSKKNQMRDVREDFLIPNGSLVRVNWSPNPYASPLGMTGVSLMMNAVQIIELRTSVPEFGFEGSEGGFTVEEGTVVGEAPGDF